MKTAIWIIILKQTNYTLQSEGDHKNGKKQVPTICCLHLMHLKY